MSDSRPDAVMPSLLWLPALLTIHLVLTVAWYLLALQLTIRAIGGPLSSLVNPSWVAWYSLSFPTSVLFFVDQPDLSADAIWALLPVSSALWSGAIWSLWWYARSRASRKARAAKGD